MTSLREYITNPKTGFVSSDKIAKRSGFDKKDIQREMDSLQTYQVNKEYRKKKNQYNSIKSSFVGDVVQIDLMDISRSSTANKGFKYLLTFIDVYSRYVIIAKLKNKNMSTVAKAFDGLVEEFNKNIINVTSDDGSEFHNKQFEKVINKHDINHWITPAGTPNKLSIVERFHRTIRSMITLYINHKRTNMFIDVLDDLIDNYNNNYHSTIKNKPIDVYNGALNHQTHNIVNYNFNVGDIVRKSIKSTQFNKGGIKFSDELYFIDTIKPNSYVIRNKETNRKQSRNYMGYELRKVGIDDNVNDQFKKPVEKVARKRWKQKRDPAFNDKYTHNVDDKGNVKTIGKHFKLKHSKRQIVKPRKLDL